MPPAVSCDQALACRFTRDPREVSRARRITREILAAWDLDGQADIAQLIVSELVTNVIRHGAGPARLTLARTAAALHIDVHDGSPDPPARRHASATDEGGRGLDLVDTLAAMHNGTLTVVPDSGGPGKSVRVTLGLPPGP